MQFRCLFAFSPRPRAGTLHCTRPAILSTRAPHPPQGCSLAGDARSADAGGVASGVGVGCAIRSTTEPGEGKSLAVCVRARMLLHSLLFSSAPSHCSLLLDRVVRASSTMCRAFRICTAHPAALNPIRNPGLPRTTVYRRLQAVLQSQLAHLQYVDLPGRRQ